MTGRVDILEVLPLTQAEIDGATGQSLILRLLDGAEMPLSPAPSTTTRAEYARRITSGGMPVVLRRPALRARLGDRLAIAMVLYTGALTFPFDDGTWVLPLDALWSTTP
ncbi:hypothetical protein ACQP2X_13845 [Actinoplanes sp. CA-131856]